MGPEAHGRIDDMAGAGDLIADRYEIVELLGAGGMGKTWKALDRQTSRHVALKMLNLESAADWKVVELFERELQVLQAINHPGVPNFVDGSVTGEGGVYLVQEIAAGDTVESVLAAGERLTEPLLRSIAEQVLEVLVHLQELQPPVIHRDIKPDNLILDEHGKVQLVDFGAAAVALTDSKLGGSTVVGTFGYMAPEQFRGIARVQTDLYGLGATLVHMATGRSPDQIPSDRMTLQFAEFASLTPGFERWLEVMTAPHAEERFESAREALAALRNVDSFSRGRSPVGTFNLPDTRSMRFIKKGADVEVRFKRSTPLFASLLFVFMGLMVGTTGAVVFAFAAFEAILFTLIAVLIGVVFTTVGLNAVISSDKLLLHGDGWETKSRRLIGGSADRGTWDEVLRFAASPTGASVNGRRLHQLEIHTQRGVFEAGASMSGPEAELLASELHRSVFGDAPATDVSKSREDMARVFADALQRATQKGGVVGTIAKMASRSKTVQDVIDVANTAQASATRPSARQTMPDDPQARRALQRMKQRGSKGARQSQAAGVAAEVDASWGDDSER